MVNRCRVLLALSTALLCASFTPAAAAAVSVELSEQVVDELEVVRLTIRASGARTTQALNLQALEKDFHILARNTSNQYQFRNGREQSWVDYQITLQPKRTGELTIAGIQVGADTTPSITLSVRPLAEQTRQFIDELVFFEQELSAPGIYVQAQLVVVRRLLYASDVQLYSNLPGAPQLSDAVVMTLGEAKASATTRRGRRYGQIEQRYAVFPELSGTLTIPAINVTASVRLNQNGRPARKGVRIGTAEQSVEVHPIPVSYPQDQPWLPARQVTLQQVLSPPQAGYQIGDTITHELLVHIQGNLGSSAPPISLDLAADEFRSYPQNPVIDDDTGGNSVAGTRRQTTSLLALRAGALTLPATRITWWNTVDDRVETTSIDAQQLAVGSVPTTDIPTEMPATPGNHPADPTADSEGSALTRIRDAWTSFDWQKWTVPLLTAFSVVVLLLLILAATRAAIRWRKKLPGHTSAATTHPRLLQRNLKRALQQCNGEQVEKHLAAWLAHTYTLSSSRPVDPVSAMLRFRHRNPAAAAVLDQLARQKYGVDAVAGATISVADAALLQQTVAALGTPAKQRRQRPLPPLYPFEETPF